MSPEEREQKINKILGYLQAKAKVMGHVPSADSDSVSDIRSYAEKLDDVQLSNFLRLTGTAASKHRDRIHDIKGWVKNDPNDVLNFLVENPSVQLSDDDFDSLHELAGVLNFLGRPMVHGSVHWNAHLTAIKTYDAIDMKDDWTYRRNQRLTKFVDAHPEDVEGILRLHNQFGHRVVTEELLSEYKLTHGALTDGLL